MRELAGDENEMAQSDEDGIGRLTWQVRCWPHEKCEAQLVNNNRSCRCRCRVWFRTS